jgi:hypothetical protein
MLVTHYTDEDLKKLPLRAIVALAARCARRVEHLAQLPEGHPEHERRRAAVDAAIRMAEDFSSGSPCTSAESVVQALDASRGVAGGGRSCESAAAAAAEAAHAAASAWHALGPGAGERGKHQWEEAIVTPSFLDQLAHTTADLAALGAFTAASEAADAVGHTNAFVTAAVRDYQTLLSLELGRYPEAGQPINPLPDGPLGPL